MVPWNALMTNDSSLSITDMTITLRPVTRCQSGTTMLESMWSSVSSSMQMAEECMKQIDDDIPFLNHNNTLIGLEKFAETIDNGKFDSFKRSNNSYKLLYFFRI